MHVMMTIMTKLTMWVIFVAAEADAAAPQPSSVHITGSSAAVPQGNVPSKSLGASGELDAQAQAEAAIGVSQRSASQRATSFVGTADYVAPEVCLLSLCAAASSGCF